MRKGVLIFLLVGILCGIFGCGKKEQAVIQPMKEEESIALGFDILGGKDVMPIAGFHGPLLRTYSFNGQSLPDYVTDEIMSEIKESGINLLHAAHVDYNGYPTTSMKLLDLAEKYGIGACVWDGLIYDTENVMSVEELDQRLNEYQDHPAYCGVYVVDEPGSLDYMNGDRNIEIWAPIMRNLAELDTFAYGNLFPVWDEDKLENYRLYVDEWCKTANPKYLSYDNYPFDYDGDISIYFKNMDIIREYAEQYKLPFWTYIQAGGQWYEEDFGREDYPTEGQLLWNVNTCLAYGAKGIQYYTVIQYYTDAFNQQKEEGEVDVNSGLLDIMGNRTRWFYYAQKANRQIAAVDHVLMHAVNQGVLVSGKRANAETKGLKYKLEGTEWRELASVDGDSMIGCFNYQGKTALYVVNYDMEYAQKITLHLKDVYKMSITQNAEESKIETNKLVLDLKAGESALVVF